MLTASLMIGRTIGSFYHQDILKCRPHAAFILPRLRLQRNELIPIMKMLALSRMVGAGITRSNYPLIDTKVPGTILSRDKNKA